MSGFKSARNSKKTSSAGLDEDDDNPMLQSKIVEDISPEFKGKI
jgi:hypothetical protein